jgi:uncharacterized protein YbjT (DUF2867 family)
MYVVAGVSGNTGRVAAETLLQSGKKVRVLVRDRTRGEPWREKGAEVAVADMDDVPALTAALQGAQGAYFLLPPDFASTDMVRDNAARTQAIGAAIAASGAPHVVFLSSIGAQHAEGTGPIRTLHHAEQALPRAAPNTRFTWIRAAYFLENVASEIGVAKAEGILPSMIDPAKRIPMVATRDIGRVAATALVDGPREGRAAIIELAGPREVSHQDLAAELATLLGRKVAPVAVPRAAVKGALVQAGLPDDLAGLYEEMAAGLDSGLVSFEENGARFVRGSVEPAEVLRAVVGA